MTHEQWIALTPEQQRIKVAELCGWKRINDRTPAKWQHNMIEYHMDSGLFLTFDDTEWATPVDVTIPDYLSDLNAMHGAEKLVDHTRYLDNLCVVCDPRNVSKDAYEAIGATAEQRAEAFVLTMEGK